MIGEINLNKSVYIVEGYATGASVYAETQCLTIVAFNASNLVPVAIEFRRHLPDIEIVIAGDIDQVGRQYAELASKKVKGSLAYPPFTQSQAGSDWNDFLVGASK
jgi:putative DNA primase/helicase